MSHQLFLSHAGIDKDAAVAVARRLEDSPEGRAHGLTVWIYKRDCSSGRRWKDAVQDALARSTAFAVYVGTQGVVNWVWDEVSVALDRAHQDHAFPLVPILAPGMTPGALPSFLSQYQGVLDVEHDNEAFLSLLRGVLRLDPRAPIKAEKEPFIGLSSFDGRHAHLFFGRDREVTDVTALLRERTLVMVTGDSGSGKSSLVSAGVIPSFKGGRLARTDASNPDETIWSVIETRPAIDPFRRLADDLLLAASRAGATPDHASALAQLVQTKDPQRVRDAFLMNVPNDSGRRVRTLVVVDQFEEVRTSPEDAARYVDALLALAGADDRIQVLVTMRRDYYFMCAGFPELYRRLEDDERRARYLLHRMSLEGLRACIIGPLRLAGRDTSDSEALARAVLRDVSDEPGELALLQMALWRTWSERNRYNDDLVLTYEQIGRVEGALAQAAEEVFLALTPFEQGAAEVLFVRLVRPGETGGATRRLARFSEFDEPTRELARKLAREEHGRLVTLGEESLELAHDQLATQWVRYQQWISNSPKDPRGDDLRVLVMLTEDAKRSGEGYSALAEGYRLQTYSDLSQRRGAWLSPSEQCFVSESQIAHEREERGKHRLSRALRLSLATAIVLSALTSFQWWRATVQRRVADEQRTMAEELSSQVMQEHGLRLLREGDNHGLLDLLDAHRVVARLPGMSSRRGRTWSFWAREMMPRLANVLNKHEQFWNVVFEPHGEWIAVATADRKLRFIAAETGAERAPPLDLPDDPRGVFITADGRFLLVQYPKMVERIDLLVAGRPRTTLVKGENLRAAALDPSGQVFGVRSRPSSCTFWDVPSARQICDIVCRDVKTIAFNPGVPIVAIGSNRGLVRLYNAKSGASFVDSEAILDLGDRVEEIVFSPTGAKLAVGTEDGQLRVWNWAGGGTVSPLLGHPGPIAHLAYSPDGLLLASASQDTVRVFNTSESNAVEWKWHAPARISSLAWSPDGQLLIVSSYSGLLWVLRVQKSEREPAALYHETKIAGVAFSRDGRRFAAVGGPFLRLWETGAWRPQGPAISMARPGPGVTVSTGVTFAGSDAMVVTSAGRSNGSEAGLIGIAQFWDAATGKPARDPIEVSRLMMAVSATQDGARLVLVADDQTKVWEVERGQSAAWQIEASIAAAFSPDGRLLASGFATEDSGLRVYDASTGNQRYEWSHQNNVMSIAFSPVAPLVASASRDGTIRLWNLVTGTVDGAPLLHTHNVIAIAFSPDGTLLVSLSQDSRLSFWDPYSHHLIAVRDIGRSAEATDGDLAGDFSIQPGAISFSPDGQQIAVGDPRSKSVTLFRLPDVSSDIDRLEQLTAVILGAQRGPDGSLYPIDSATWLALRDENRSSLLRLNEAALPAAHFVLSASSIAQGASHAVLPAPGVLEREWLLDAVSAAGTDANRALESAGEGLIAVANLTEEQVDAHMLEELALVFGDSFGRANSSVREQVFRKLEDELPSILRKSSAANTVVDFLASHLMESRHEPAWALRLMRLRRDSRPKDASVLCNYAEVAFAARVHAGSSIATTIRDVEACVAAAPGGQLKLVGRALAFCATVWGGQKSKIKHYADLLMAETARFTDKQLSWSFSGLRWTMKSARPNQETALLLLLLESLQRGTPEFRLASVKELSARVLHGRFTKKLPPSLFRTDMPSD